MMHWKSSWDVSVGKRSGDQRVWVQWWPVVICSKCHVFIIGCQPVYYFLKCLWSWCSFYRH